MTPLSKAPVALNIPDHDSALALFVHGEQDKFVSRQIRNSGIWEPYETHLVCELLHPGAVFLDVGANIGYFSILAASLVGPEGTVLAFEPDPDNCRLFAASIAHNHFGSRIELVEAGLADCSSAGTLYLSDDNLGDHQIYASDASRPSVPITLHHGGDYLGGRLAQLDLIKIDTQGSEYAVVSGLASFLCKLPRTPQIIIELTPYSLREAGASGRALIELLATLGQPFWIIDHIEHRLVRSGVEELARWCDNVDACDGDQGFMNILVGRGL